MGELSRLSALALSACLLLALPAQAEEPPQEAEARPADEPCSGNCTSSQSSGNSTSSGNQTAPAKGNSTSESGRSSTIQVRIDPVWFSMPGGSCDLVRTTGTHIYLSVNPVLGVVTVNPYCLMRYVPANTTSPPSPVPPPHL